VLGADVPFTDDRVQAHPWMYGKCQGSIFRQIVTITKNSWEEWIFQRVCHVQVYLVNPSAWLEFQL